MMGEKLLEGLDELRDRACSDRRKALVALILTLKLRTKNNLMDLGECGLKMSSRARRGVGEAQE